MKKTLKIYNASAGSGKTYQLVKEYIQLLIEHPTQFKFPSIVAMTFTNKAALEMKERIISDLDAISTTEQPSAKAIGLTEDIAKHLKISEEEVQKRCKKALSAILHRYEEFHVLTIDKFNLRIIKSFSKDLDLPADFEIMMDEEELLGDVINEILNKLGDSDFEEITKTVFAFAESNLNEDKKWDFRRDLLEFSKVLTKEQNDELIQKLLALDFSSEWYVQILNARKKLIEELENVKFELSQTLGSVVNPSKLVGGQTALNQLEKFITPEYNVFTDKAFSKTIIGWFEKEIPASKFIPSDVFSATEKIVELRNEKSKDYAELTSFLNVFYSMALLRHVAQDLISMRSNENIIRISEFNKLISDLIKDESAPFIYEKLGNRFKHFLLDEFQDTSHLQFLNMVPLIDNAISEGEENLIVGDPKQSIYRFNNGLAEQFVALPKIYNPQGDKEIARKSALFDQQGEKIELEHNWRSSSTIVDFNNRFFGQFKQLLSENSQEFYSSTTQIPSNSTEGSIHILSEKREISLTERVEKIVQWIEQCKVDGYKYGDICILGDRNKKCNKWAVELTKRGYKIVSAESLLIKSSMKVELTIAYLKRRLSPDNPSFQKQFAELFFRLRGLSVDKFHEYIEVKTDKNSRDYHEFNDNRFLTDYFEGKERFFQKKESLYNLILGFFELMEFKELKDPYLHRFADYAYEFGLKKGPNLKLFIEDYQKNKGKIAVEIPASSDAIKIMTIHKSKGLEFPVVIMPNLDFKNSLANHDKFLFQSDKYILHGLPNEKSPIPASKELAEKENESIRTDSTNLLYVGFTRPQERLYVLNHFDRNKFALNVHNTFSNLEDATEKRKAIEIKYDAPKSSGKNENLTEGFLPEDIQDRLWFPEIALQDKAELKEKDFLSPERQRGVQFHHLMTKIESEKFISEEVKKGIDEGLVSIENESFLRERIKRTLNSENYQSIIDGARKTLNEQAIISEEGAEIRPDKIVFKDEETIILDFKTGVPKKQDAKQVLTYVEALSQMNFPKVKGCLYYTELDKVIFVG